MAPVKLTHTDRGRCLLTSVGNKSYFEF